MCVCVGGGVDEMLKNILLFNDERLGEHLMSIYGSKLHPQIFLVDVLDDDTVEVVNVVMNNMENYLPSDVINQDKDV